MADPNTPPDGNGSDRGNIAAVVVVIALVIGGIWLFSKLSASNETLNCVASGRTNCHEFPSP